LPAVIDCYLITISLLSAVIDCYLIIPPQAQGG
jgi:hypothetical protein